MMHDEFVRVVGTLSKEQKTSFYIHLARNVTIAVRGIWSDETISVDERCERMKWMNEAMHRVINRLSDVRHDQNIWTDDDLWQMLRDTIDQCPSIRGDLGGAVHATLKQTKA